ncbi:MAG: hypothetical protein JO115_20290 [Pseudonocardiales bacterium]|nr:hypothetical protein [Pseudonocardiales bacterium]
MSAITGRSEPYWVRCPKCGRRATPASPHTEDTRLPILTARLVRSSATAYAIMGGPKQADRCLAEANDGWEPPGAFERAGADLSTAGIALDLGRLEAAEQFATKALGSYGEGHRRARTLAELRLAEVHIRAGEPQGLTLAHHALEEVRGLHSVATRRERLIPLAAALDTRPGTDAQDLVRTARRIATIPS